MLSTTSARPFKLHMSWPKACCLMQSKLCTSAEDAKASMMQFIDRAKSSYAPQWLLHLLQSTASTTLHKRAGHTRTPATKSEKANVVWLVLPYHPALQTGQIKRVSARINNSNVLKDLLGFALCSKTCPDIRISWALAGQIMHHILARHSMTNATTYIEEWL